MQMDPMSFKSVVRLIRDNPTFSIESNISQASVDEQLKLVFLYRPAYDGSGVNWVIVLLIT